MTLKHVGTLRKQERVTIIYKSNLYVLSVVKTALAFGVGICGKHSKGLMPKLI